MTGGGPGKRCRTPTNHAATSSSTDPPTNQSALSLGGCTPMMNSPVQPATHTTASGRYHLPRCHGPIFVHVRPYAQHPSAVGSTYEMYSSTVQTAVIVS